MLSSEEEQKPFKQYLLPWKYLFYALIEIQFCCIMHMTHSQNFLMHEVCCDKWYIVTMFYGI